MKCSSLSQKKRNIVLNKPILKGEKVSLRPITLNDADAMFAGLSDEEAMKLTGTQEMFTLAQVRAFCARVAEADDRLDYAITLPDNPRYRGEVVLNELDWANKSANFRIAISGAENREKGYGTEAARLILRHAFEGLRLHRVHLEVFNFNRRAQHVYRKLGFVREGVLRDTLLWEGEYHNSIQMSLLASDYRAKQTRKPFGVIETERLMLRRLCGGDVETLATYRNLPEVAWMQLWEGYTVEEARELVHDCNVTEPFTAGGWFQFGVALKTTDELVGDLYLKVDEAGKQAEIGYTFDPEFQGRGLATEAVRGLVHHAFTERGLHRIWGVTDPRNTPSIKLMKRVGLRQEAHHQEDLWFKGAWADDVIFAVLAKEWQKR